MSTSFTVGLETHRPEIRIGNTRTRLLVEQIQAVDQERRFGPPWGVSRDRKRTLADALRLALSLF